MLIFDELKKNDPQLRLVAMVLAGGLGILLAGLWWVQVVSAHEYKSHLETQAYRSVRIPAVRGKILDREGRVLADNRPRYNLSLYLDDLRKQFDDAYDPIRKQALAAQKEAIAAQEKKLGRALTKAERRKFAYTTAQLEQFHSQSRLTVANQLAAQIGQQLGQPLPLDPVKFDRAYKIARALPYPILKDLNAVQIARFEEKFTNGFGADLELQATRVYPSGSTAAHLLGYVLRDDRSEEEADTHPFNYYLPDYQGQVGVEAGFDTQLHGRAGAKSVLINSQGYRQSENIWEQPEPGHNVVLTIDLDLQRAVEASLLHHQDPTANAAVVVMDVRNGDVLAMASLPTFDPNDFSEGISTENYQQIQELAAEKNRATQENYAPGSIFKVVVGLAALELGLDPEKEYTVEMNPSKPPLGCVYVGRRKIEDTAPAGSYKFKRAIEKSSNSYFIQIGLDTGIDRIVALAEKFHFGEKCDLPTRQETSGDLPTPARIHHNWHDGDTANLCIGQGEVAVTPLQMAVAYSAIANGGTVFWPRLVSRIEPHDQAERNTITNFPAALVRDHIGVSARSLQVLHNAMLGETEDPEGTGQAAQVPGLRICGKTGTAQVQNSANVLTGYNYWFASFAPYENPKYAVVVMVQKQLPASGSGGKTCAPIAHDIYEAILKIENAASARVLTQN